MLNMFSHDCTYKSIMLTLRRTGRLRVSAAFRAGRLRTDAYVVSHPRPHRHHHHRRHHHRRHRRVQPRRVVVVIIVVLFFLLLLSTCLSLDNINCKRIVFFLRFRFWFVFFLVCLCWRTVPVMSSMSTSWVVPINSDIQSSSSSSSPPFFFFLGGQVTCTINKATTKITTFTTTAIQTNTYGGSVIDGVTTSGSGWFEIFFKVHGFSFRLAIIDNEGSRPSLSFQLYQKNTVIECWPASNVLKTHVTHEWGSIPSASVTPSAFAQEMVILPVPHNWR